MGQQPSLARHPHQNQFLLKTEWDVSLSDPDPDKGTQGCRAYPETTELTF